MATQSGEDSLLQFNPKLPKLSKTEKKVLDLLVEAAKLIAPIYKLQENKEFPGANFYPHDATKEEIKEAAEKDPQILSPYTIVERVKGKLVVIPYHIKYADLLKPIAVKLEEAADITDNEKLRRALKIQAEALLNGSYDKATIAWLNMEPNHLEISIGPNDYFDDQLFFTKNSYQAWVGILDIDGTERLNNYKNIIQNASRKALMPMEKIENPENIKAKVLDTLLFSGLMAKTKFPGVNYPIDLSIVENHGSEITLFNQPNDLMMEEEIIPAFNEMFSKEFKGGYDHEDLRRGSLRYTAMHEFAHSYLYYRSASEKLQDLFRPIFELAATLLGFRLAGSLLLKDRITNKQLESMIIAFLCRCFYLVNKEPCDKFLSEYKLGGTIFINFLLESDALKNLKGMAIPNFMKIFVALQDLSYILELLLSTGDKEKAEVFVRRYGQLRDFRS